MNIRQAQATQKRPYDRKQNRQGEFRVEDDMPIPGEIQESRDKLMRFGPIFVDKECGENTYDLKRMFHSDMLRMEKRANTGDMVSANAENGMCDGAQHSAEETVVISEESTKRNKGSHNLLYMYF